ncbi:DUF1796 family putative cysteine peptidase [Cerasicoccus frondis]|uniref:DUF1796 family putative cysteine peptidase n=1 Tax=Cerasicoccus frondis TaxID=490090 RepID=UPI0028526532|nr:DUF1796 family putative cysteine peptidase [Cerasicoccus frondis]
MTTYIPIGIDCEISEFLRRKNLRKEALPFDWNVTPIESAFSLLENRFSDFLNPENLVYLPPTERLLFEEEGQDVKAERDIITPVVCRKYGMLFPHDFSAAGVNDLEKVRDKYARRIQRLLELLDSPAPKQFVYRCSDVNVWQREQYTLAGEVFRSCSAERVRAVFDRLSIAGGSLISLDDLQVANLSFLKRGQRWASGLFRR